MATIGESMSERVTVEQIQKAVDECAAGHTGLSAAVSRTEVTFPRKLASCLHASLFPPPPRLSISDVRHAINDIHEALDEQGDDKGAAGIEHHLWERVLKDINKGPRMGGWDWVVELVDEALLTSEIEFRRG